jgi:hypothetical protein
LQEADQAKVSPVPIPIKLYFDHARRGAFTGADLRDRFQEADHSAVRKCSPAVLAALNAGDETVFGDGDHDLCGTLSLHLLGHVYSNLNPSHAVGGSHRHHVDRRVGGLGRPENRPAYGGFVVSDRSSRPSITACGV